MNELLKFSKQILKLEDDFINFTDRQAQHIDGRGQAELRYKIFILIRWRSDEQQLRFSN